MSLGMAADDHGQTFHNRLLLIGLSAMSQQEISSINQFAINHARVGE